MKCVDFSNFARSTRSRSRSSSRLSSPGAYESNSISHLGIYSGHEHFQRVLAHRIRVLACRITLHQLQTRDDWECGCGFGNCWRSFRCRICGSERSDTDVPPKVDGDWDCGFCGVLNFLENRGCYTCGGDRADVDYNRSADRIRSRSRSRSVITVSGGSEADQVVQVDVVAGTCDRDTFNNSSSSGPRTGTKTFLCMCGATIIVSNKLPTTLIREVIPFHERGRLHTKWMKHVEEVD